MEVFMTNLNDLNDGRFLEKWGRFTGICKSKDDDWFSMLKEGSGDPDLFKKIALHCLSSGHYSGCRHIFFEFCVKGLSRSLTHQLVRHSEGVVINQQSLRYVNAQGVPLVLPQEVNADPELLTLFFDHADDSAKRYQYVYNLWVKKTGNEERAREIARMLLPMAISSSLCIAINLEALVNLGKKRLCKKAESEFREFVSAIVNEVINVVPELEPKFGPPCKIGLPCPEKISCQPKPLKQ